MIARRLPSLLLAVLVMTGCHGAEHGAPPAEPRVPGVETGVARNESLRELLHAGAVIAAYGDPPDVLQARADLTQAEARLRLATAQLQRAETLAGTAATARKDLEAARAEQATAQAAAERAHATAAAYSVGEPPSPLESTDTWAIAQLLQGDAVRIDSSSAATFTADALPEVTFVARIDAAPAYVDAVTHTAPLRLRVRDPEHRLRPGMTGGVHLEVGEPRPGLVVPTAAVVYDERQPVVFVEIKEARYEPRPVVLGVVRGEQVEIRSGIEPGAKVVVTGAASLLSAARLPAATEGD